MNRYKFHKAFATQGPVVLPVIHVVSVKRTLDNIDVAIDAGAPGCFLINHDFGVDAFLPIIRDVRAAHPSWWMGVNFLGVTGRDAFPILAQLQTSDCRFDAYWADDARIDERSVSQCEAKAIAAVRDNTIWRGLYFGGVAFKKQRTVAAGNYKSAAAAGVAFMDVVTTSGVATGLQADLSKISAFRSGIADHTMALASGITPDNAEDYQDVDCFMVATGINKPNNFYDIDPARLVALLQVSKGIGEKNST
ncbi:MAG: hypothetical protein ACR2PG_19800 [Hyphomicrobiaceae bacterium]